MKSNHLHDPRVRTSALLSGVLALTPACVGSAHAQEWPTRPLTMVVPFSAGGTTDVIARIFSPGLSEALGQQVIVENVSGGGGVIGSVRVSKAAPDGYQFILGNVGTHAQNQSLLRDLPYNAAADFIPVALLADQSMMLVVRKDLPVSNLREFGAYAKANQQKMQFGSAGAGSPTHLACALLNAAIGINVVHVPYRGGGPAMQDLMAGRIDYFCYNTSGILPQVEASTVKPIAILSRGRSPALPTLASAHEQGLNDFEVGNWLVLFLPKGTPVPIVRRLHDAATVTANSPQVQDRLKQLGVDPADAERQSLDYLPRFIESEIAKWTSVIKGANLRME